MKKLMVCWLVIAMIVSIPAVAASKSGLEYTGEQYYAKVKNWLYVRNAEGEIVGKVTQGDVVMVLGRWTKDPDRSVIKWDGGAAHVLRSGLRKTSSSTNVKTSGSASSSGSSASSSGGKAGASSAAGRKYCAVTTKLMNLRDASGNLVCTVPKNAMVYVNGKQCKEKDRISIAYGSKEGTVLKSGVKEIKDAVFVNISAQKVTLIRSGKVLAESKCVTGMRGKADTPKGKYSVTARQTNRTLRGVRYDGKSYAQPVKYWISFSGSYGLHDASWRGSFGGSIYKSNGSNGCVNLPSSFAKTVYVNTYKGMPVYIY